MTTVEHDPAEVGVDAQRLARIDTHLARYVDDGRLAGRCDPNDVPPGP